MGDVDLWPQHTYPVYHMHRSAQPHKHGQPHYRYKYNKNVSGLVKESVSLLSSLPLSLPPSWIMYQPLPYENARRVMPLECDHFFTQAL